MITSLEALLLGIVQGLTEFFPVSSSAHLQLLKLFLHIEETSNQPIFELSCHLGTLVALVWALREKIRALLTTERKSLMLLFLALFPLVPIYFFLKPLRDLASTPNLLGVCLILTGSILFAGTVLRLKTAPSLTFRGKAKEVLWIGTSQGAALIPGISRSASTISCARLLGWNISDAVQFSFLLSIPAVMGGNFLEIAKHLMTKNPTISVSFSSCLIGFLSSLGIGLIVVGPALRILMKGHFKPFAWYCIVIGSLITLYLNVWT
jgi:undecaprenyl-diphosphatase